MDAKQVCDMIDAITEGRDFEMEPPMNDGEPRVKLIFTQDEVSIYGLNATGFATGFTDPRVAREIAGALVAWANRKEGEFNENSTNAQHAIEGALGCYDSSELK